MIEIITGVVVSVGGGAAWYYTQKILENRILIKRIKSSDDNCVAEIVDLYKQHFPDDGTNYTPDEVVEMMDAKCEERRVVDEGETATFLKRFFFNSELRVIGFAHVISTVRWLLATNSY